MPESGIRGNTQSLCNSHCSNFEGVLPSSGYNILTGLVWLFMLSLSLFLDLVFAEKRSCAGQSSVPRAPSGIALLACFTAIKS